MSLCICASVCVFFKLGNKNKLCWLLSKILSFFFKRTIVNEIIFLGFVDSFIEVLLAFYCLLFNSQTMKHLPTKVNLETTTFLVTKSKGYPQENVHTLLILLFSG